MAIKIDPLALATHGIVKEGGATDPLGLATFGLLVVDGGAPPVIEDDRGRRTYVQILSRSLLLGR